MRRLRELYRILKQTAHGDGQGFLDGWGGPNIRSFGF